MEAELAGAKKERAKRNDEEVLAEIPALCSPGDWCTSPRFGFQFRFWGFRVLPFSSKSFLESKAHLI